ncbi:MAG: dihydroorotase [Candidatus Altimarinota bacterium]
METVKLFMKEFIIRKPDDFHLHLRQGELMGHLVKETAKGFQRVLVMPNTLPPVTNAAELEKYHSELKAIGTDLEFLMTFKLMPDTSPATVQELKKAGAVAGKLYPQGVTTHSEDGVADVEALFPIFSAMQEQDLVLCLHGEVLGVEDLKRESAFLPTLKKIHQNFPQLRIVLEHVSTADAVQEVQELGPNVAATITVHHLFLTTQDVRNGHFNPHHFCAPICKSEADRAAIVQAALSGHPKFFFGSDSAPHPHQDKEGDHPKPGIYTTPVALPLLAELFESQEKLDRLEAFTSQYGADYYRLPLNTSSLILKKEDWQVPGDSFGIIPLRASEVMKWRYA